MPMNTVAGVFEAGALRLRLACACGRSTEFPEISARKTFGLDLTLYEIAARARCERCGRRPSEVAPVFEDAAPRATTMHFGHVEPERERGAVVGPPPVYRKKRRRKGAQSDAGWGD